MSDLEIIKEFLVESYENLDRLDRDLVALERDAGNPEILASVFRTIHTIKGTSGFLAFNKLEAVTHIGESLLARLRDGQLTLNPDITTALLAMVDAVRQMLGRIEDSGNEGERNDQELIATLTRLLQPPVESSPTPEAVPVQKIHHSDGTEPAAKGRDTLINRDATEASDRCEEVEPQDLGNAAHPGEIPVENVALNPQDLLEAPNTQQQVRSGPSASDSTIRVDVAQLDRLMNRMGELVLLRNQIVQFTNASEDSGLLATSQRLNLLTTELQEGVMKTRMQPIGNIWSRFPRTVRDVALGCGKQVRIEMEGKETELDKTIIEAIKDPLTHIVRNSVDHGIESPKARSAAGKNPEGRLFLRAFHEGGQVNIEITDDGAGLDHEKIRNKAIQKGMITADQAARMTEREITNLIWLPGLSTAEKVTNVSGRGVGMDVVRTNIEKIGGTVDVQSKPGQGSTVRMKIPLTLAIIPALIVTTAGDRYAIPQVSLLELVRLEGEQARNGIELVHGAPVYRLRGRLLPLVCLNQELKLTTDAGSASKQDDAVNIVVLQADDRQFGLVVDEINDTEEIVVKPLLKQLKSVKTFAGSSIMGDGKVALILDVLGLAQRASVVTETKNHALAEKATETAGTSGEKRSFLLFAGPGDSRMAIPLSTLARLEEFPVAQVEMSGSQWVTQYRGRILPLVRLTVVLEERRARLRALQAPPAPDSGPIQVLVLNHEGRQFGLVVERILDIVEDRADVKSAAARASVLYSVVIGDRVTELLDIPAILRSADWNATPPGLAAKSAGVTN